MAAVVGIRELRNQTSALIDLANRDGEVIITRHGEPVAVLRPYVDSWKAAAAELLAGIDEPFDTGLAADLAADDSNSSDDLTP